MSMPIDGNASLRTSSSWSTVFWRFFFCSPLLVSLVVLCPWGFSGIAALGWILVVLLTRLWQAPQAERGLVFILGFFAVVLAGTLPTSVLLLMIIYLSGFARVSFRELKVFLPFLAILCAWIVIEFLCSSDLLQVEQILGALAERDKGIWWYLRNRGPAMGANIKQFTRYGLLFLLMIHFQNSSGLIRPLLKGMFVGLLLASAATLIQISNHDFLFSLNSNTYWQVLNRYPATFSDPNAYGIFTVLLFPFMVAYWYGAVGWRRILLGALTVVMLSIALYSGSRSLLVGLFLYALYFVYRQAGRTWFGVLVATVGVFIIGLNLIGGPAFFEWLMHLPGLPTGVRRVVETLAFHHVVNAVNSKLIFMKASLAMIVDNPWVGVGFGDYRMLLPHFLHVVSSGNQVWTDNANNFYLGLLAELGCAGALLLLSCFVQCRYFRKEESLGRAARVAGLVLLVLLFVGPHFDFDEVIVIAALIGASVCRFEVLRRVELFAWMLLVLALPFIVLKQLNSPMGIYALERTKEGEEYFWTERQARFPVDCHDQEARFFIRMVHPAMAQGSLTALVNGTAYQLEHGKRVLIELPCDSLKQEQTLVSLGTEKIWIPALELPVSDYRALGLQIWTKTTE
ncbi:MAG: O-antigen ligase family protein [Bdellovibrionales bacterium]|nr:O-antigen ligase family protein [Bdellovibrionales bacterium]